ncbi:IucA/IucC family protein, partial [Actinacidiphila acididurans]
LTPGLWQRATRHLIRKAIAEFTHERLLAPVPETRERRGGRHWALPSDDGATTYRFRARRLALDHWDVDPESLTRHSSGGDAETDLDALAFVTDFRTSLGLSDQVLPVYLEEITSTLSSLALKLAARDRDPAGRSARALARAPFQTVEAAMTEGHPCFVANSGRLGFGLADLMGYAPEAAAPVRLFWLAAHRDHATFTASPEFPDQEALLRGELDEATRDRFAATLRDLGLDPADYLLIPAHTWQWEHRLAVTFAGEVAERRLVPLGPGDERHLPQQSLRTFLNADRPERHYVKTALSVLNMGFVRGLSAAYMEATPAINDWLAELIAADPTLTAARLTILRERAAIGYHHRGYERATVKGSPYRKMLAALWRESPVPALEPGRSLMTMAALLHTDADGRSVAGELIARSGTDARQWLRAYLEAYLVPVAHSLYAHDLAFMPHGENVILVLDRRGTVERAVFKDIAEEIVVMDPDAVLPPAVARIRADVPVDQRALTVFTDVFDCFFRFLSALLHTEGVLDEDAFWRTVAECLADYQRARPELAAAFRRYDLFAPEFALSCLNRLQLRDNQQMVDLADPSAALQFAGTLRNPLAAHRALSEHRALTEPRPPAEHRP